MATMTAISGVVPNTSVSSERMMQNIIIEAKNIGKIENLKWNNGFSLRADEKRKNK
jgi:hypothetical protein